MRRLSCLLVFAVCSCQGSKEEAEAEAPKGPLGLSDADRSQVVAKVDGVAITVGEFADRINKQSPYIRARYTSVERKKEFLDNLVRFEVLASEAKKRGFDKHEEVVHAQKQAMIQKLMKAEFETASSAKDVPEEELKKFYDEHISEYQKPEQVRISQIVTKDKKTARQVASQAKAKPQDSKLFRDLVSQHSIDEATKARGGDLRYFGRDDAQIPKAVVETAFGLDKIGAVAKPVETEQGFVVVKLTGRRKELNRSFEEVKRQIQNRLYRQRRTKKMEDFVIGLKDKPKIKIFEEKLALVPVDANPPGGPNRPGLRGAHRSGMPGAPVRIPRGSVPPATPPPAPPRPAPPPQPPK
jgi:peptidyl-prolyl cis-trans isomerase C